MRCSSFCNWLPNCFLWLTALLVLPPLATAGRYQLGIYPTNYDFGTVVIGQSVAKAFTLKNVGPGVLTFANGTPAVPHVYGFSLSASTCGKSLVPGSSCEVAASYAPQTPGRNSVSFYVEIQESTDRFTAGLLGFGVREFNYHLAINPAGYDFGTVPIGLAVSKTFTLTNTGTGTTTFANGTPAIPHVYGFTLSASTCGKSLVPGSSCEVTTSYAPQNPGLHSVSFYVEIQESTDRFTAGLRGVGTE